MTYKSKSELQSAFEAFLLSKGIEISQVEQSPFSEMIDWFWTNMHPVIDGDDVRNKLLSVANEFIKNGEMLISAAQCGENFHIVTRLMGESYGWNEAGLRLKNFTEHLSKPPQKGDGCKPKEESPEPKSPWCCCDTDLVCSQHFKGE